MVRLGIDPITIDRVLITHFHPDHTTDLVTLLFARQHPAAAGHPALRLHGPVGLESFYERLQIVWPTLVHRDPAAVRIEEMSGGPLELGPWLVTACSTRHSSESQGYRVALTECSVAYTGDTGPSVDGPSVDQRSSDLVGWARDVDLLITECNNTPESTTTHHLNSTQAGQLACAANARCLLLTHLPQEVDDLIDPTYPARRYFPGPIRLAEEGLTIDVATIMGGLTAVQAGISL
jgi:ribonuclease BN (tRNA processing enzyme)